jgi:hypothetical protein
MQGGACGYTGRSIEKPGQVRLLEKPRCICHPERSEGSRRLRSQILRLRLRMTALSCAAYKAYPNSYLKNRNPALK